MEVYRQYAGGYPHQGGGYFGYPSAGTMGPWGAYGGYPHQGGFGGYPMSPGYGWSQWPHHHAHHHGPYPGHHYGHHHGHPHGHHHGHQHHGHHHGPHPGYGGQLRPEEFQEYPDYDEGYPWYDVEPFDYEE